MYQSISSLNTYVIWCFPRFPLGTSMSIYIPSKHSNVLHKTRFSHYQTRSTALWWHARFLTDNTYTWQLMIVITKYDHHTKYRWKKQCQWLSGINFVCVSYRFTVFPNTKTWIFVQQKPCSHLHPGSSIISIPPFLLIAYQKPLGTIETH